MLRDKIKKTLIESCSPGQLFEISVTIEDVIESIVQLKMEKRILLLCLLIILNLFVVLCLILYLISLYLF